MKKIVTLHEIKSIELLSPYVDGFLVGTNGIGTRLTRSFSVAEILEISQITARLGKQLFIQMNRILHDQDESRYETYLKAIDSDAITGYIIGDIGVANIAENLGIKHKMIYNPETLLTNSFDVNFYASIGLYGAFIAKEITLDDILNIASIKKYPLFMYIHGYLNMFYSKRQLINAYFENQGEKNPYHGSYKLTVKEEKRPTLIYKTLEDEAGTHVFRNNVYSAVHHLGELSDAIDFGIIDTIFHNDQYALDVVKLIDHGDLSNIPQIEQTYQETWDEGFFFKHTVYKPKKVNL